LIVTIAQQVPTVGEIARRVGEPIHCVEYVIRSRGIEPVGLAGNARVFSTEAVKRIEQELRLIKDSRAKRHSLRQKLDRPLTREEIA
jgi:hypothetical protein